jgi:hypothetical protein
VTVDEDVLSKPLWMGRRRFGWGITAVIVSGLLGVTVHLCSTWALETGPKWLVFFVLPEWTLIFGAHLVSGAAAVTGLALLLPPFLRRISGTCLRRLAAVLSLTAAAVASLPWSYYLVGLGLNTISSTYRQVTAANGESVIIEHSGFDRRDYSVFLQESPFLWVRSGGWHTAPEVFDPAICTFTIREADYLLTCGTESVTVSPPNRRGNLVGQ